MTELLGPDGGPLDTRSEVDALRTELQEAVTDRRLVQRHAEELAWTVLDQAATSGVGGEMQTRDRIKFVRQARDVWAKDPQAGAAADLLNAFVFGRGVPRPNARDEEVQRVIDEAWDDPDNQLVLTSFQAQIEKGLDLSIQSNLFIVGFVGDDGRVKLGLLDHDTVTNVVRDPENRLRVLYYVTSETRTEWDFDNDRPAIRSDMRPEVRYYAHWRNVADAEEAGEKPPKPPKGKLGEGVVYHVAVNRTTEMAFGVPTMRRTMRWFSAYNEFMSSRVDVTKAAAAFIMKRKVRGGEAAVQRVAQQVLNRRSELASARDDALDPLDGPRPGSILNENEGVTHEAMNLQSGAGSALQDGQMIRSQISAATHFPQHYLGDAGSANLATATCHDDQTEALTSEGWMGLEELKRRDRDGALPLIAAFNEERGGIVYEAPKHGLLLHDYDGPLVEFRNSRHADFAVTPNHRMLLRKGEGHPYVSVEAGAVTGGRWETRTAAPFVGGVRIEEFVLPARKVGHRGRSAESEERQQRILALAGEGWSNKAIAAEVGVGASTVSRVRHGKVSLSRQERPAVTLPMDAWLEWLGWWIAEGSDDATVYQSEDSAWLAEVQRVCRALGVEGVEGFKQGRGARTWYWRPRNPSQFMAWLREHVGAGAATKRVPEFVFALAREQQMCLLRGLMGGDGHAPAGWEQKGSSLFSTTSEGLADDVQRIGLACGFFARLRCLDSYATKRGIRSAYTVALCAGSSARKLDSHGRLPKPTTRHYRGQVWCFTLPSDTMVTRRNGIVGIARQSMELPVLKHVESYQEVWEGVFRWFIDLVIEQAVESGRIPPGDGDDELAEGRGKGRRRGKRGGTMRLLEARLRELQESSGRDLYYEFAMPSPLRRMTSELVNSVSNVAKTFDPNGTNLELSRLLLGIALGQGLEIENPGEAVEKVFPEGYQDPMLAAYAAQQAAAGGEAPAEEPQGRGVPGQQQGQENPYGPPSPASDNTPASGEAGGNPYGVRRGVSARNPEQVKEARFSDLPPEVQASAEEDIRAEEEELAREVFAELDAALAKAERNGDGG